MAKQNGYIEGRLVTTRKWHVFGAEEISLCGLAVKAYCTDTFTLARSKRSKVILWPDDDLNYCGRCRLALIAHGEEVSA